MRQAIADILEQSAQKVRPGFNIQKEIELLEQELMTISGTEQMMQTSAWKSFEKWMRERISLCDKSIVALAENPELHAREITQKKALRTAFNEMLSCFQRTVETKKAKAEQYQKLKAITTADTGGLSKGLAHAG